MGKYIYESPDKGKTVYRREFGSYDKRERLTSSAKKKRELKRWRSKISMSDGLRPDWID